MSSAMGKDILREIKKKLSEFISIAAILALGVSFFIGIRVTGSDMRLTGDDYFDNQKLADISVMTTLGVDDKTASLLRSLPDVEDVSLSTSIDTEAAVGTEEYVFKTIALPDSKTGMNLPVLVSGKMPEQVNECVVDDFFCKKNDISIGERITLRPSDGDNFTGKEYTVVGTVNSPLYISNVERGNTTVGNGKLSGYLYLLPSAYASDLYTTAYITVKSAVGLSCFSSEYDNRISACIDEIKGMQDSISQSRIDSVRSPLQQELDKSKSEYEDNQSQADRELSDAKAKLDNARADLDNAIRQFDSGLDDTYAQIGKAKPKYSGDYTAAAAQLRTDIDAFIAAKDTQLAGAYTQLELYKAAFPADTVGYAAKKQVLDAQSAQWQQAKAQLIAASDSLSTAADQIVSGQKEYEKGLSDYESQKSDALGKLADAKKQIDDAQKKIDDIASPTVYALNRDASAGYSGYGQDSDRIEAIGRVFPLIFFLVAALICLSTVTRMVEEQRTEIGTLKALGYSPTVTAQKYILFALSASIIGLGFGALAGFHFLPVVIYNAYRILYRMPELLHTFQFDYFLFPAILALLCTTLTAYMACKLELRSMPAKLMRPAAPPAGKRIFLEKITPLWNRFSFLKKVTARNLLRKKMRFWMTVLGIAGCTGLLITGFGLRDSIMTIVDKQYTEITTFQTEVLLDKNASVGDRSAVMEDIRSSSLVSGSISVTFHAVTADANGNQTDVNLIVPSDVPAFGNFTSLRSRATGNPVSLTDDGVVIDEKLAEMLHLSVGDSIKVTNTEENIDFYATITGITENYLQHYVYMTPQFYSKMTGKIPDNLAVEIKLQNPSDESESALSSSLLGKSGINSVIHLSSTKHTFSSMMNSFNIVIWVIIAAAASLALIVMYTLSTINISERVREIATIKVLGFYDRETSAYIYRENVVLTVIGILLGLGMGVLLHYYVVVTSEIDLVMFVRSIAWESFLYSIVLTILFATVVNIFMHFRLKKIDMATALKSIE